MKKFKVTYNHDVYKPSNYEMFKAQQAWSITIEAEDLNTAKGKLKLMYIINPAYFNIVEVN